MKKQDAGWWNYRVIRKTVSGGTEFGICEVYYRPDGRIHAIVDEPAAPFGTNLKELTSDFRGMQWALRQPFLIRERIKFYPDDRGGEIASDEEVVTLAEVLKRICRPKRIKEKAKR